MKEKTKEKIKCKLSDLNWFDKNVIEIMNGLFEAPIEVINIDNCSEVKLYQLKELLEVN